VIFILTQTRKDVCACGVSGAGGNVCVGFEECVCQAPTVYHSLKNSGKGGQLTEE